MRLKDSTRQQLLEYLVRQLQHFFPDQQDNIESVLAKDIDAALARLNVCINAVKMWKQDEFYYLHSSQYATFLYFLANSIWHNQQDERVCTKLFFLNKALNGIDCFYEIEMPDIFLIGHSVGIVLAKAEYANYLVLYQNSTVGKNHGIAPVLEEGVIMYPNTAIIGSARVRKHSVIAQGVSVINHDTQGNSMVFQGAAGELVHKPMKHDLLADYFRM